MPAHMVRRRGICSSSVGGLPTLPPPGLTVNDKTEIVNGMLLVPGLVNAHTHGHGSLTKGMGDRWTLELLLNANP